jgi:hypothetical protein
MPSLRKPFIKNMWGIFALLFLPLWELHMDTWTHRWMDGQTALLFLPTWELYMDPWTHRQTDGWMERGNSIWTHGHADGWTDGHHCNPFDILITIVNGRRGDNAEGRTGVG